MRGYLVIPPRYANRSRYKDGRTHNPRVIEFEFFRLTKEEWDKLPPADEEFEIDVAQMPQFACYMVQHESD